MTAPRRNPVASYPCRECGMSTTRLGGYCSRECEKEQQRDAANRDPLERAIQTAISVRDAMPDLAYDHEERDGASKVVDALIALRGKK